MYDICCIGHITSDKVVTTQNTRYMPGGTAFYFSHAVNKLDLNYILVTAIADAEMKYVTALRDNNIETRVQHSANTVYFENIYGDNPDERTQNVWQKADAFTIEQLQDVEAGIFHLGPLLADDISTELIRELASKGPLSLDVQGYLRKVENNKVFATSWPDKKEALQYIGILKADVAELQALTGYEKVNDGAALLLDWGVKEVVITNASKGSAIYTESSIYTIPAYPPEVVVDTTGCGDTYMAGYLYQRVKGADIQQSGEFAAAMAGLKTTVAGAFTGTATDVLDFMKKRAV